MALKKNKNDVNENNQQFNSKYLSNAVNDLMTNITAATKLPPNAFKHLAEEDEEIEYIPLGVPELDKGLNGGLPRQTVVEIYGPPGGGKSYLACYKAAAAVTQNYGNVCIYDIENAFNRQRAEALGVATNRLMINNIYETGEQVLTAVCEQIYNTDYKKKGLPIPRWADLIVIDSIAALGSRNQMDADFIQDIDGIEEKSGPKKMPASRAMMISDFQGRLVKSINNSAGIWPETMPGTFLPDNSFYSFLSEDQHLPDSLIEDIKEALKVRHTVLDPKHPDLWIAVWMAQNRRDKLDKYFVELKNIIGEDKSNEFYLSIENKKTTDYHKLKNIIKDNYECGRLVMKIDNIVTDILKGKKILPATPDVVKDFEIITNGYIYNELTNEGLPIAHYNPGPTLIILNQVRTGNIGGFTPTTIERPGGYTFKHAAGTVLYVTPITSKSKGEIQTEDGKSVAGWKSRVLVEKSRFAAPKNTFEMIIPFIDAGLDEFNEFMSDCQKMELWSYSRNYYNLPKDGSIIKTKDEFEWKERLLEEGLSYLQKSINYGDDQMAPIYAALSEQLVQAAIEDDGESEENNEY